MDEFRLAAKNRDIDEPCTMRIAPFEKPNRFIGLQIGPMLPVETDDAVLVARFHRIDVVKLEQIGEGPGMFLFGETLRCALFTVKDRA